MSDNKPDAAMTDEPLIVTPLCSIFRRFLKQQGLKFTTERAVILDAVLAKDGVFEVDELMFEMRQQGHRVSKATIYRTIKHLVEAEIIQEVLLDSRQAHYQLVYGREPADHLVNVDTDEIVEIHSDELTAIRDRICAEHGVQAVGHRFLIYASAKPAKS
jgi:Fur family ferric uptake transcriptional regulator